jgi:hypothetical protein
MPYYLDVGTGSSNWTWQALLGVGYAFDWGDVNLSDPQPLAYDFNGKNDADLRMTGPTRRWGRPSAGRRIPAWIPVLLVGLLALPVILPASASTALHAENLSDTTPVFTQPQLLAVANLDQRISDHHQDRRHSPADAPARPRAVPTQPGHPLPRRQRLCRKAPRGRHRAAADAVASARRSGDKTAEMTAILRLNSAILDQSFSDLLATVAQSWFRFAPPADFVRAFKRFEQRTAFNQAPFGRAVQHLQAAASATTSPTPSKR